MIPMKSAAALVIVFALVAVSFSGCLSNGIVGFTQEDLNLPFPADVDDNPAALPSPLTSIKPAYSYSLEWVMTEVFVYYGGAMELNIRNTGDREFFIYGYGFEWLNSTTSHNRNAEAYVQPDELMPLGLLCFSGPSAAGLTMYSITLKIVVRTASGTAWHDYGEVTAASRAVEVYGRPSEHSYSLDKNVEEYYNKVNSRVNFTAVQDIAEAIVSDYPGEYSTLHIAAAFDWVRSEVAYETDDGGDYWQSTEETLTRKAGDCEDQAILMASIIGALGGNARVNIINEHAFPTVLVAMDEYELGSVRLSFISYYGTQVRVCFLEDSFGYWLVVDTAGFPYAGGLPATASPSDTYDLTDWTFDNSDWLVTIDATGEVANGGGIF